MSMRLLVAVGIVLFVCLAALFPNFFLMSDIKSNVDLSMRLSPPSYAHPLGCDLYGQDVFTAIVLGARTSLYIAFFVIIISVTIGTITGIVAGFFRGFWDSIIMRLVDVMMAFL